MTDLAGGHVDLMIDVMNTAVPQIKAGCVKPIAVLNTARGRPPFPDLPALSEAVPETVQGGLQTKPPHKAWSAWVYSPSLCHNVLVSPAVLSV